MASFVLSFFPLDVLGEIWDLIESVSKGFLTYSCDTKQKSCFVFRMWYYLSISLVYLQSKLIKGACQLILKYLHRAVVELGTDISKYCLVFKIKRKT